MSLGKFAPCDQLYFTPNIPIVSPISWYVNMLFLWSVSADDWINLVLQKFLNFLIRTQLEGKKSKKIVMNVQQWIVGKSRQKAFKKITEEYNHITILSCELWIISDIKIPFWISRIWALSAGLGGVVLSGFAISIFAVYGATGLLGDPKKIQ